MSVVSIANILQGRIPTGNQVTVNGWVRTRRDSNAKISFLGLYDGSCFNLLQIVIRNTIYNYKNDILHLSPGCSVRVTGYVVESLGGGQSFEIQANEIDVLGWVDNPDTYPISSKKHSIEYLREVAHLRPRTNIIGAITRVRHTLAQSIHNFMNEQGFFLVSTPLITAANTEGAGEMFRVSTLDMDHIPRTIDNKVNYEKDFFGKEAFLTVSGQLNCESYACAISKVYTFGPTFRAENSNTSRHLSEFWMIEPEMAFFTLKDIISFAESLLKYVFNSVLTNRIDDMNFFANSTNKEVITRLERFINTDIAQIDYTEAIEILRSSRKEFKNQIFWGIDFSSEHERYLAEQYFKAPVVVKNYPKEIKAFYSRINDDNTTVATMDILVPGIGEIIGGSQREERLYKLDERLNEMNLNKESYWWYRDLRRYGTVPHSGFGLGFERLIVYVTGMKNIRDVIPFPRSPRNVNF